MPNPGESARAGRWGRGRSRHRDAKCATRATPSPYDFAAANEHTGSPTGEQVPLDQVVEVTVAVHGALAPVTEQVRLSCEPVSDPVQVVPVLQLTESEQLPGD
jgi:hypothetical protein